MPAENLNIHRTEEQHLITGLVGLLPNLDNIFVAHLKKKASQSDIKKVEAKVDNRLNSNSLTDEKIISLLESNQRFQWINGEIFSENKGIVAPKLQKDVFSEVENNTLIIRLKGQYNQFLFVLIFHPESANFGPVRNGDILATTSKSILESMIYNHILYLRKTYQEHQAVISQYNKFLTQLREKANSGLINAQKSKSDIEVQRAEFAQFLLKRITQNHPTEVVFNAESLKIFEQWQGDLEQMEDCIIEAFHFAQFTDYQEEEPILVINQWHIPEIESIRNKTEHATQLEAKYLKAYSLLDRLEAAAIRVASEKQKLTGSAVGQSMNPPISAPAISDALKKNMRRLRYLLSTYPDKWNLIRSEFRPIQNLLDSNMSSEEKKQA